MSEFLISRIGAWLWGAGFSVLRMEKRTTPSTRVFQRVSEANLSLMSCVCDIELEDCSLQVAHHFLRAERCDQLSHRFLVIPCHTFDNATCLVPEQPIEPSSNRCHNHEQLMMVVSMNALLPLLYRTATDVQCNDCAVTEHRTPSMGA